MKDQLLMKNLMRAYHSVRRTRSNADNAHTQIKRGYGYILDILDMDEGINQQKIAEMIGIRQQSVSEAVSIMEQQGYITKAVSPNDKRVTLIYITEEGNEHRKKLAARRLAHAQKVFSIFSDDEKTVLLNLLEKLNNSLAEEGDIK